jgi:hypothetical protein
MVFKGNVKQNFKFYCKKVGPASTQKRPAKLRLEEDKAGQGGALKGVGGGRYK